MTQGDDLWRKQVEILSKSNCDMVREFHETYNCTVGDTPSIRDKDLRISLMREELREVEHAIAGGDMSKIAKELSDLLYVVYGTAIAFGLPGDECFAAVHASNMSKLGPDGKPIYRDDGKVLKGPNYFEPDLSKIINR